MGWMGGGEAGGLLSHLIQICPPLESFLSNMQRTTTCANTPRGASPLPQLHTLAFILETILNKGLLTIGSFLKTIATYISDERELHVYPLKDTTRTGCGWERKASIQKRKYTKPKQKKKRTCTLDWVPTKSKEVQRMAIAKYKLWVHMLKMHGTTGISTSHFNADVDPQKCAHIHHVHVIAGWCQ